MYKCNTLICFVVILSNIFNWMLLMVVSMFGFSFSWLSSAFYSCFFFIPIHQHQTQKLLKFHSNITIWKVFFYHLHATTFELVDQTQKNQNNNNDKNRNIENEYCDNLLYQIQMKYWLLIYFQFNNSNGRTADNGK